LWCGDQGTLDGDVAPLGLWHVAGSVAPTCLGLEENVAPWRRPRPLLGLVLSQHDSTKFKLQGNTDSTKIELTKSTLITKPENPNASGKVNQRSRWSPKVFF